MTNKPHFIIGGERRSGSTTLYNIMKKHSEVNIYPVSDMDYFIKNELFRSKEWYIDKDDDKEWSSTHTLDEYLEKFNGLFDENKIVGQKDADLLFWKPAHKRLKEYLADTKFIFVLRNPVSRADSQYWNELAKGRETLKFTEALSLEEERSEKSDYGRLHLNYKERGKYIESINHFREFFSDDKILVVILEKLKNDPKNELKKIANFLNISVENFQNAEGTSSNHQDVYAIKKRYRGTLVEKIINFYDRIIEATIVRILPKDREIRNKYRSFFKRVGKDPMRKKEVMSEKIKNELHEYYKDSILELEKYLGYDLKEWTVD